MAVETITEPVILDSTGQDILEALGDIKDVLQPTNVGIDMSVLIPSSGWPANAPYTYTWINSKVTTECVVNVDYGEGSQNTGPLYIAAEKVAGGVQFTSPVKPLEDIPVTVHILNAAADSVTDISADMVSTMATGSASNVEDVLTKMHEQTVADGAGAHNAIYRGKYLGNSVTAEQWAAIKNGKFTDLFIGDYWTINSVNWRIAAFDYWVNANSLSTHHVVIVPDSNLTSAKMNETNTTSGAYYGSDFRTGNNSNTGRATAISAVNSAFGSGHILTYKDYLHSAVTDGHPSGQEWADCTVELMNEEMVYGGHIFAPIADGTAVFSNYTTSKSQLPLFQHEHSRISNRADWWLRSVVSGSYFALVGDNGSANNNNASNSFGVRPAFGIYQS